VNYEFLAIVFAVASFCFGLGYIVGYKRDIIPEEYPADLERSAREKERHRISRELHDHLGQSLILLKFKLYALKLSTPFAKQPCSELEDSITITNDILTELRSLVHGLHEAKDFYSELVDLTDRFSKATRIETVLPKPDCVPSLSTRKSSHLLRIIQECMTNAAKHGKCSKIQIRIQQRESVEEWSVCDYNKTPVSLEVFQNPKPNRGLGFMKDRVQELSGECKFSWTPEFGTCVHVFLPRESAPATADAKEGEVSWLPNSSSPTITH
jgi:signal transduction histidine kinase